MSKSTNVFWHDNHVLRADRETKQGHPTAVIWFTGLSGSGKSTLANELDWRLFERGINRQMQRFAESLIAYMSTLTPSPTEDPSP